MSYVSLHDSDFGDEHHPVLEINIDEESVKKGVTKLEKTQNGIKVEEMPKVLPQVRTVYKF